MPDTRQLAILKALTAHLEGITPSNGYPLDLSGRVHRGRATFGADERTPFVSILEAPRPDLVPVEATEDRLIRAETWHLLVQGWTDADPENPTDPLYTLKGFVEARLAMIVQKTNGVVANPAIYRLGGLIADMRIGPGVVRAATPQIGGTEAFYLPVSVTFAMNVADPFDLT